MRDLLRQCPRVQVLATSREALEVGDQGTYVVPPMAVPLDPESGWGGHVQHYDSVRLFARRVVAACPEFVVDDASAALLARLSRRLDGIPLAIELAAARARQLTLPQIEQQVADRFRLLRDGRRVTRSGHETMKAVLDDSYALLSGPEQALFARLSVFRADWTVEAAESICAGDGIEADEIPGLLQHLEGRALLLAQRGPERARYGFLETVREYADAHLAASGSRTAWEQRHVGYFLQLAETAAAELNGPRQVQWLRRLDVEHRDCLVALHRASAPATIDQALRLGNALAPYWRSRGGGGEATVEFAALLAVARASETGAPYAEALTNAGWFANWCFQPEAAERLLLEALGRWRVLGDAVGEARTLRCLAQAADRRGDLDSAGDLLEQSLALVRVAGDRNELALTTYVLACREWSRGDRDALERLTAEGAELAREQGNGELLASVLGMRAVWAFEGEDYDTAVALMEERHRLERDRENPYGIAICLNNWASMEVQRGNTIAAERLFLESGDWWREIRDRPGMSLASLGLAEVHLLTGDINQARLCLEASLPIERRLGPMRLHDALGLWARLELASGCPEHALCAIGAIARSRDETGHSAPPSTAAATARAERAARAALGEPRAAQAMAAGRCLGLDRVAAAALGERPWQVENRPPA